MLSGLVPTIKSGFEKNINGKRVLKLNITISNIS